jgi:hypothetical protein
VTIGGGNSHPYQSYGMYHGDPYSRLRVYANGGNDYAGHDSNGKYASGFANHTWSHAAMTLKYDEVSDTSTLRLYLNGGEILSDTIVGNSLRSPISDRQIVVGGYIHKLNDPVRRPGFELIDEVRVSNAERSAAWLAASYRSQRPGSDMLSFDSVEPSPGIIILVR